MEDATRTFGKGHEVININLRNKPEWYYTKHPFGQIPVLENSKCQLIYESVIACEYLDDAYPGRKLYPYDPYERARQKMLLELFYKRYGYGVVMTMCLKVGRLKELKTGSALRGIFLRFQVPHLTKECLVAIRCGRECADLKLALRQEFCNLEEAFTHRKSSTPSGEMENIHLFFSPTIHHFKGILGYQNTVFFGGDCISMIDYLFWPWFERLDVYGIADLFEPHASSPALDSSHEAGPHSVRPSHR
ncbi:glutathione S-transferase omega-2 isoform X1 [Prionailurus iriomotensis]